MTLSVLREHLDRGGAALLSHPATYAVAEGAVIAPARYAAPGGGAVFVHERRFVDGRFVTTTLIDSKQSQSNRSEQRIVEARHGGGAATEVPMIEVTYPSCTIFDATLPHRAVDAHIRSATEDGTPVVDTTWYRALRDATHADLSPVFTTSPVTLAFGGWDSTRARGQLRIRSHYVSELFGVVDTAEDHLSRRNGGRLDPLGQDFNISPDEFEALLDRQRGEMSPRTVKKLEQELTKARKGKDGATVSASTMLLGGIPPGTDTPYGVSVPEVRRARTYSLAGLRRLRFGGSVEEDVAARAALLALLLLGAAYADADPEIRAYCDVASPKGQLLLDEDPFDVDASIDACEAFLTEAVGALPPRLAWRGQTKRLVGDPALDRGAVAETAEE